MCGVNEMGDEVAIYKLWTIHSQTTWERFVAEGVLRSNEELVRREFLPAYRWMAAQMRRRLPACTGRVPVWALKRALEKPGSFPICPA